MVDVACVVGRQLDDLAEPQLPAPPSSLAPRAVPARELREEDAQRRGLDRVEPGVRPDELEGALVERAVEAQLAHDVRDPPSARDETAVLEREEVLRRVEAERRADAGRGDAGRAERLRRVLEQGQVERGQLGERRWPAEECAPGRSSSSAP